MRRVLTPRSKQIEDRPGKSMRGAQAHLRLRPLRGEGHQRHASCPAIPLPGPVSTPAAAHSLPWSWRQHAHAASRTESSWLVAGGVTLAAAARTRSTAAQPCLQVRVSHVGWTGAVHVRMCGAELGTCKP